VIQGGLPAIPGFQPIHDLETSVAVNAEKKPGQVGLGGLPPIEGAAMASRSDGTLLILRTLVRTTDKSGRYETAEIKVTQVNSSRGRQRDVVERHSDIAG
jgi:hypothetical protein